MSIGIITPIYKQSQHLYRLLASVLPQCRDDDMLMLVCEQQEFISIEKYLSLLVPSALMRHVGLFANNTGIASCAAARNVAMKCLSDEIKWLKFLDADDVLAPFALDTFRKMQIPDAVHCIAGAQMKVVDGCVRGFGVPNWGIIERINPCVPSMTFVRRAAFERVGGFNSQICFEEDYDFWLRLRREFGMGAFATVKWPVCYYWISQEERASKDPVSHQIDGVDVREYFAKTYAITPER